jgi:small-conductance mechanosensitive channel
MGTSGWDKFKTRRKRLRAVSAKESAHIDQASQEAVRLLTLLLLLVLATYCIKVIIADCCFACMPSYQLESFPPHTSE